MQIVSTEDNLHGMSNPADSLYKMPKYVFREKWKKKKKKKRKATSKCFLLKILQSTEYLALKRLIVKTSWLLCEYISLHNV